MMKQNYIFYINLIFLFLTNKVRENMKEITEKRIHNMLSKQEEQNEKMNNVLKKRQDFLKFKKQIVFLKTLDKEENVKRIE